MDSNHKTLEGDKAVHAQPEAPDHEEIARIAYRYYEARGCVHGLHEEDWFRAEDEIRRRGARTRVASAVDELSDAGESTRQTSPLRTVIGVFPSMNEAQRAFDDLIREGFTRDEISFVANKAGTSEWTEPSAPAEPEAAHAEEAGSRVAEDAGIGAAVGGVGGLLLSFAGLAIPGIGPVLASGPIVAALGGASLGAAAGGLMGALVDSGIPETEAGHYAEGVRRGGILITVRAAGERADRAAATLDKAGALDIDDRVSDWRNRGWTAHDKNAAALTEDELRREREYHQAALRQGEEWSGRTSRAQKRAARREAQAVERGRESAKRVSRIYPG